MRTNKSSFDAPLPGDPSRAEQLAQIIRVNQAGEYGAKRIYEGQLAVLGHSADGPVLKEMLAQEEEHLAKFNTLVAQHNVRPTALEPIWHVAGFALGAATALMGRETAMACTVAVEDVISEHYAEQAQTLGAAEPELKSTIEKFRADELHHRDVSLQHGAAHAPAYPVLTSAIKTGTRLAIWLSKRI